MEAADAGDGASDAPAEVSLLDLGAADEPVATVYDPSTPCGAEPFPACANAPSWPRVLTATDVGDGVEFVAAHLRYQSVAVAARDTGPASDGPFILVAQAQPDGPWSWHKLPPVPALPATTVPVGVAIAREPSGDRFYAMFCDPSSCRLYSGTYDFFADAAIDGALTAVPGGVLSGPPVIRGLALRSMQESPVCAFGDGVDCFDGGSWVTLVEPDAAGPFQAAAPDGAGTLLMAGGDGLIRAVSEDGTRSDVLVVGGPTLVSIHAMSLDWAAGGRTGEALSSRAIQGVHACRLGQEPIVGVRQGYANTLYVSASGRVVRAGTTSGWCEAEAVPVSPVVAVTADSCGIAENVLALTADSLFGSVFCAVD